MKIERRRISLGEIVLLLTGGSLGEIKRRLPWLSIDGGREKRLRTNYYCFI
jgi:hypothetical protein